MGGYGALLLAERHPGLLAAVAAISLAVWTSYAQARASNAGAYASAPAFAVDDVVTHAERLVASLGARATVQFEKGGHDETFFIEQEPRSLAFLATHPT
jgi:S-formylglutathione hydrolase FrmB